MLPLALAIPGAVSALGSLYSGITGAGAAKKAANAQQSIASQQLRMYHDVQPYYQTILQQMAERAGIQLPTGAVGPIGETPAQRKQRFAMLGKSLAPTAATSPLQGGPAAQTGPYPGIYGQSTEDRLRLQQAQEDIDKQLARQQSVLGQRLGRQGIGGSTLAAAQTQTAQNAMDQFANFRRQLAIQAGMEQERRRQELLGAIGPGFGGAGTSASIYGQLGNQAQQQVASAGAGLGGIMGQLTQYLLAKQYGGYNPKTPPIAGAPSVTTDYWRSLMYPTG